MGAIFQQPLCRALLIYERQPLVLVAVAPSLHIRSTWHLLRPSFSLSDGRSHCLPIFTSFLFYYRLSLLVNLPLVDICRASSWPCSSGGGGGGLLALNITKGFHDDLVSIAGTKFLLLGRRIAATSLLPGRVIGSHVEEQRKCGPSQSLHQESAKSHILKPHEKR